MEKFSRFNDPFTSVNPFTLPPYTPSAARLAGTALAAVVKVPLLVAIALVYAASVALVAALPLASSALRNAHTAVVERACARAALVVLGLWSLPEVVVPRQSVRTRPSKSAPRLAVAGGDVLLVNRCGWVDVLVLAAVYAPVFTVTSKAGGLRAVPLWAALAASVRGSPDALSPTTATEASAAAAATDAIVLAAQSAWGLRRPLVVWPEGAPTNNKAVLEFTPVAGQVAASVVALARGREPARASLRVPTTHVVALRYTWSAGGVPPVFTAGSPAAHAALALGAAGGWGVTLLRLPEGHEPQPADFYAQEQQQQQPAAAAPAPAPGSGGASSADAAAPPANWPAAVRDGLVQLMRGVRPVALDAARYDEYLAFWAQWRHGVAAARSGGDGRKTE